MYQDQLEPLKQTGQADNWFMEYSFDVAEYVSVTDKSRMAVISEQVQEDEKKLIEQVDLFRKTDLSSDDKVLLDKFDSAWKDFKSSAKQVMTLASEGKHEDAANLLESKTRTQMEDVNTILNGLTSNNENEARTLYADSQNLYSTIRNLVILVIIITICSISVISYLLISRLKQQIDQLFRGMEEIGKGDLKYQIKMNGTDELAHIAQRFDEMAAIIRGVSEDILNVAKEAGMGNLRNRITAKTYTGEFLDMVTRINDLINAIVVPLDEAMRLAGSYASSNFVDRFNEKIVVNGEFVAFKEALNQVGIQTSSAIKGVKKEIETLTAGMEETAASMEEIAGSMSMVADGAVKVSSYSNLSKDGVKQSLVALDELSNTVGAIASKTELVSATALKTVELSSNGKALASQADTSMSDLLKSVNETEMMINDISGQMEEIGKIVFLISRIADQTSLLALNAAIEAARAGEAGLGFAVVADEVKELAQDSQDSTEDIAEIIGTLQKKIVQVTQAMKESSKGVRSGNEAVSETLVVFNQIADAIDDIHLQMGDIAGGTEEQAAATEEITASVHELGTLIEKTSDEASGSAASTEEVSGAVTQVNKVVTDGAVAIQKISDEMNRFTV